MTTTITIPTADYQRAKSLADERHISVDDLFVMLIHSRPEKDEHTDKPLLEQLSSGLIFNPNEHTQEEIDQRFDEIEKELEIESGITHQQMMKDIREEFSWLQ